MRLLPLFFTTVVGCIENESRSGIEPMEPIQHKNDFSDDISNCPAPTSGPTLFNLPRSDDFFGNLFLEKLNNGFTVGDQVFTVKPVDLGLKDSKGNNVTEYMYKTGFVIPCEDQKPQEVCLRYQHLGYGGQLSNYENIVVGYWGHSIHYLGCERRSEIWRMHSTFKR